MIWCLFAFLGVVLVYANGLTIESGFFSLFYLGDIRWEALGLGGIMILLLMVYLVTFAPRKPKMRYISFDSGNGAVSVSVNAIQTYISKLSGEFGSVVNIEPKVRTEKDRICIDLNVHLVAGVRIPELSQTLQTRVRDCLRNGLGIDDIHEVKVRILEITGEPRSNQPPIAYEN